MVRRELINPYKEKAILLLDIAANREYLKDSKALPLLYALLHERHNEVIDSWGFRVH